MAADATAGIANQPKVSAPENFATLRRLFANDRLTVLTVLFCLGIYGPLSRPLFSVGGAYLAEAPIAIVGGIILLSLRRGARLVSVRSMASSVPILMALVFFALLGIYNEAQFLDVYSDFRAIAICIVSLYVMFGMDDESAIRVILISFLINIVLYALMITADLGPFVFSESTFASGKLSLPTFTFVFGILYIADRSKIWFLISAVCLAIIGSSTSLRYIYAMFSYLIVIGAGFTLFGFRSKFARTTHLFSILVIAVVLAVTLASVDFVRLLLELEVWARALGVGEQIVHQVIVKTTQNLTTGLNYGDAMYLQFATHLLDLERFLMPHGLGHEASIGKEAIFGANTIDNSVIFLNYHFGILITLLLFYLACRLLFKLLENQTMSSAVIILLFVAPLAVAFYMRAIAFTEVGAAISFAMALRGLQVLANDLRRRAMPTDSISAASLPALLR